MEQEENFYEELLNHDEVYLDGKKKHFKWLIWIFLILILAAIGYVVYLKLIEEKEEEKTDSPEVAETEKIDLDCDDECEYDVTISNQTVKLTYTKTDSELEDTSNHKLSLDGTVIINQDFACGGPATLSVLDDIILISYHDGCDITGNTIHAYTKDGKELFNYEIMDTTYNMWMKGTDFTVVDKTIQIPATRMYHNKLRLNTGREVDICKELWTNTYDVDLDTISSGVYEIEYEGNSTFKDPVLKEKETVEEIQDNCNLEA